MYVSSYVVQYSSMSIIIRLVRCLGYNIRSSRGGNRSLVRSFVASIAPLSTLCTLPPPPPPPPPIFVYKVTKPPYNLSIHLFFDVIHSTRQPPSYFYFFSHFYHFYFYHFYFYFYFFYFYFFFFSSS